MGGQKFTASQLAALLENFASAEDGTVPGSYLIDGSVDGVKLTDGSVDYSKLDAASVQAALDLLYATVAQGANADTAFSWGDHALAGYALASQLRTGYHDYVTAAGGETTLVLSATPVGTPFVLYTPAAGSVPIVWRDTVDYTIAGNTITYVTVTPLLAGDLVDVQYIG